MTIVQKGLTGCHGWVIRELAANDCLLLHTHNTESQLLLSAATVSQPRWMSKHLVSGLQFDYSASVLSLDSFLQYTKHSITWFMCNKEKNVLYITVLITRGLWSCAADSHKHLWNKTRGSREINNSSAPQDLSLKHHSLLVLSSLVSMLHVFLCFWSWHHCVHMCPNHSAQTNAPACLQRDQRFLFVSARKLFIKGNKDGH